MGGGGGSLEAARVCACGCISRSFGGQSLDFPRVGKSDASEGESSGGALKVHMRVRIDDPRLSPDLLEFLERATCVADCPEKGLIDVDVPTAHDPTQARTHVALFLAAWQALHPHAHPRLIDTPPSCR